MSIIMDCFVPSSYEKMHIGCMMCWGGKYHGGLSWVINIIYRDTL